MKIVQVNSNLTKKDSIANVILSSHRVFTEAGFDSTIVIDTISDYDDDFVYPLFMREALKISWISIFKKALFFDNKTKLIKGYFHDTLSHYRKVRPIFDAADVRIWHNSGYLLSSYLIHTNDIVFFHNYTYPYLRDKYNGPNELNLKAYLPAYNDLNLNYICPSQFNIDTLHKLNINYSHVYRLPLYHNYKLPYISRHPNNPKLIAWGRYAKNKAVPELVEEASESNLSLTYFGDNYTLKEYIEEKHKAQPYVTKDIRLLGQVDDFEAELSNSNIYICNSYHEGFNLPLIEAEAHSLPVLARSGTAMDELVKNGYNGYLFNNIKEIPDLIDKIMKNYKQISYNAWKHSQNYTYERFKQNYLKILREYKR